MKPDTGWKSRFLLTPRAFDVPVGSRLNIAITVGTEKLEWFGYPMMKKKQLKIRLLVLTEFTNVMDRQTDEGQTGGHRMTA